jgi:hypothetical protein
MVGDGSRNTRFCQLAVDTTGLPVLAVAVATAT